MTKKILIFLFLLLLFLFVKTQTYATISTAPLKDVQKAVLDYGYKGEFCEVDSTDLNADKLLTPYLGDTPDNFYNNLYQDAKCKTGVPAKEILIGDVRLEYVQGASWNESFFIVDEKMYRAGMRFFSYYPDKTKGGTYKSIENTITGLEVIGSNYFFESEYDKDASLGAQLTKSGYISHFDLNGKQDWTLLAFEGKVYKLSVIIKQVEKTTLLDNTLSASPISTPTASPSGTQTTKDWKEYLNTPYSFSIKYPDDWVADDSVDPSYGFVYFVPPGIADFENAQQKNTPGYDTKLGIFATLENKPIQELIKGCTETEELRSISNIAGVYCHKIGAPFNGYFIYLPFSAGTATLEFQLITVLDEGINEYNAQHKTNLKKPDVETLRTMFSTFKYTHSLGIVSTSDTANWLSYKNDNFGFKFLYPPFLDTIYKGDEASKDTTAFTENKGFPDVNLDMETGSDATILKNLYDSQVANKGEKDFAYSKIHQVQGKNITFTMFYTSWIGGNDVSGRPKMPPVGGFLYFYHAYAYVNGKIYSIQYNRIDNNGEPKPTQKALEEAKNYFEKILSTFEITK